MTYYDFKFDVTMKSATAGVLNTAQASRETGRRHRVLADMPDSVSGCVGLFILIDGLHELDWIIATERPEALLDSWCYYDDGKHCFPPNVWLAVRANTQAEADERLPAALRIPAAKHVLLADGLRGPLNPRRLNWDTIDEMDALVRNPGRDRGNTEISWVIAGGGDEPVHPDWLRTIRVECEGPGRPFFFTGWGEWVPETQNPSNEWRPETAVTVPLVGPVTPAARGPYPNGCVTAQRIGRHATGRLLDGREHNEVPG